MKREIQLPYGTDTLRFRMPQANLAGVYSPQPVAACADPAASARDTARLALVAVLLIGVPLDWRAAPRADLEFPRHAERFEQRRPGKRIRIPIPPEGWKMKLVKR